MQHELCGGHESYDSKRAKFDGKLKARSKR